jgi:hypothetical protein
MSDARYYCLRCNGSVNFEELKALENCSVCGGRFCKECTDRKGVCKSCLAEDSIGFDIKNLHCEQ